MVYAGKWYNGQRETTTEYIGNKRSILIGMPRLRQLRVLKGTKKQSEIVSHFCTSQVSHRQNVTVIAALLLQFVFAVFKLVNDTEP